MTSITPGSAPINTLTQVDPAAQREEKLKPISFKVFARLFAFTKPYKLKRNLLVVAVLTRSMQVPALSWILAYVIYGPISNRDPHGIILGVAAYLGMAVFSEIVLHFRQRWAVELGEDVVRDMRQQMFEHLQKLPMIFFDRTKLGRVISRFTSDAESVRGGITNVVFTTVVGLGQMVFSAAIMLYCDWVLFMVLLAMAPIFYLLNRYFRTRLSMAHRDAQESMSRVTATMAESISGIRVTQGFNRENVNAAMFHDLVADHSGYNMARDKLVAMFAPLLDTNTQIFTATLLIFGGYRALHGEMGYDVLFTFLFQANVFFGPVLMLGNQFTAAMMAMAGAERVFRLLDTPPDWEDAPDAKPLPPIEGRVVFKDLQFGYRPDQFVLKDINFVAEPGQTVALVGHTGSGKSSIIKLIAKFYEPTDGELLIDGYDIRKVKGDSLHHQMGIVLQENFLFSGTVMDNIRYGKPDATDEQVVEAARRLDCLDMISDLPDGFYTDVGEGGGNLSLGQRQLVCFTRAMVANPRILILDEATSAVDTMTEARIQKALEVLLEGRTSFVVAHRLSTIRHASMVLVLDHGYIIERGTHNQLLATGGVYANLYRQFIRTSEGRR